jgi:hypothetical protein
MLQPENVSVPNISTEYTISECPYYIESNQLPLNGNVLNVHVTASEEV